MVAQKKGRGAKTQAAKAKAAAAAAIEEQQQEAEVQEPMDAADDNNGDAEQLDQSEGAVGGEEGAGDDQGQEHAEGDAKPEDKKEEKVETGKLLVENLPSSYLFDYQEKLKELFSKHGEVLGVKWVNLFCILYKLYETCFFANIQISVPQIIIQVRNVCKQCLCLIMFTVVRVASCKLHSTATLLERSINERNFSFFLDVVQSLLLNWPQLRHYRQ